MIIKDKVLGKYMIEVSDAQNYSLYYEVFNKKKQKIEKRFVAYFSGIENCIRYLIKIKLASSKKVVTLEEFLNKYRKYELELIKVIRSRINE